jgi:hypothetical protein
VGDDLRFEGDGVDQPDPIGGGKSAALRALRKHAADQVESALQKAQRSQNANVRAWATRELRSPSSSGANQDKRSNPGTVMPAPAQKDTQLRKRFVGYGRSQGSGGAQSKATEQANQNEEEFELEALLNIAAVNVEWWTLEPRMRKKCAEIIETYEKAQGSLHADALVKGVSDDLWVEGRGQKGDPEAGGKAAALRALRKHAPEKVEEALQKAQKSRNANVRAWATRESQNH